MMIGITQGSQLREIEKSITKMYEEMLSGYIEDGLLQTAVNIQVEVNRMVWLLNEVYFHGGKRL